MQSAREKLSGGCFDERGKWKGIPLGHSFLKSPWPQSPALDRVIFEHVGTLRTCSQF